MRHVCAFVLALTFIAGQASAAEVGALSPGQSAGIAKAQTATNPAWVLTMGAVLLGAGAYLISTQHDTISSEVFGSNDNGQVLVNNTATSTTTSTH